MKRRAAILMLLACVVAFLFFLQNSSNPYSDLTTKFASPNPALRAEAYDQLIAAGPKAAPAVGKLLRQNTLPPFIAAALNKIPFYEGAAIHPDAVRDGALAILTSWGPAAAPALPDIISLLNEPRFSQSAERLLRLIGPPAAAALVEHLRSGPEKIRAQSARVLRDFPSTLTSTTALIAALRDKSPNVRAQAATSLGALQIQSALLPLLKSISDNSPLVRANACEAVGKLNDKSAITALTQRLHDSATAVQLQAAKALWKIQPDPKPLLSILTQLLTTPEAWQAAYALADLRSEAAPAIPALIQAIRRENVPRPFRSPPSSTYALGRIGAPAIPALIEALHDPSPIHRQNAAIALAFMETAAAPATETLLQATRDPNLEVRQAAALALGAIGSHDPRAIKSLADCLHAEDIILRSTALNHLRKLDPQTQWSAASE